MTAEQFAYWLQGFAELTPGEPTPEQWQAVKDHLALVFNQGHADPHRWWSGPRPDDHAALLAPNPHPQGQAMLSAITHIQIRQLALQWATASAVEGEDRQTVLDRAQAYLDFMIYPAKPEVVQAMRERAQATSSW